MELWSAMCPSYCGRSTPRVVATTRQPPFCLRQLPRPSQIRPSASASTASPGHSSACAPPALPATTNQLEFSAKTLKISWTLPKFSSRYFFLGHGSNSSVKSCLILLKILEEVQANHQHNLSTGQMERLERTLVSISDLFQQYAVPLQLFESQLKILESSNHEDPNLVNDIWLQMVNY
jgi:hypothetical protein